VILVVVITFDYAERVNQINDVAGAVERLSLQFGISVEFVADYPGENDGMTYERTRQLISSAQHSLVFVDYWTETANYREGEEQARARRNAYYGEILSQIELSARRNRDGAPFHRRIIQFPGLVDPDERVALSGDESFLGYTRQCLAYQEVWPRSTVVKICPPHVNMHFAVIDRRFVILPILTSSPRGGGLRRHGALIFEDRVGELVAKLMNIYAMLDAVALPLEERHMEQPPG